VAGELPVARVGPSAVPSLRARLMCRRVARSRFLGRSMAGVAGRRCRSLPSCRLRRGLTGALLAASRVGAFLAVDLAAFAALTARRPPMTYPWAVTNCSTSATGIVPDIVPGCAARLSMMRSRASTVAPVLRCSANALSWAITLRGRRTDMTAVPPVSSVSMTVASPAGGARGEPWSAATVRTGTSPLRNHPARLLHRRPAAPQHPRRAVSRRPVTAPTTTSTPNTARRGDRRHRRCTSRNRLSVPAADCLDPRRQG
jgi:hypothetical protein